jgi:hypothetical protein
MLCARARAGKKLPTWLAPAARSRQTSSLGLQKASGAPKKMRAKAEPINDVYLTSTS